MLSKQLDDWSWLLAEEDHTFLVVAYYNKFRLHINIGLIDNDIEDVSMIVVEKEIWKGEILTVAANDTLGTVLKCFAACADHIFPFELVYSMGGQLSHTNIVIPGYYLAQHAGTTLQ